MNDTTPVIFRIINKELLAIFPTLPANRGNMVVYAHIGQHGEASIEYIQSGRPALPEEYDDLLQELVSMGYDDLKVYKRIQRKHYGKGWK